MILSDCLVLITRPEQVATETINLFTEWGADVCHAPVLTIQKVDVGFDNHVADLDTIIFVSRHAVQYSAELTSTFVSKSDAPNLMAVGPATAAFLESKYNCAVKTPESGIGGKALLESFDSGYWSNRKVGIVRGVGAPTDLDNELVSLGAEVQVFDVYNRQINPIAKGRVDQFIAASHPIKVVAGFSSDSLSALRDVALDSYSQLATLPLLVVSKAIAQRAIELSWSGSIEVSNSTDAVDLHAAIIRLNS